MKDIEDDSGSRTHLLFEEIHPPLNDRQALLEGERCLHCGGPNALPPCMEACPANVDVPRFIQQIQDGQLDAAAGTIFHANVLGGSCARVCPVDELCEGACVLRKEGRRPVEIGRLQRFATDHGIAPLGDVPETSRGASVGVIGAGPAGIACAAELAHMGFAVTVYEKRHLPGGLITYAIAPYKQQVDPILYEVQRVRDLGVDFQFGKCVGEDVSVEELFERHAAVFVGAGMGKDTAAGIPGEDLLGVWESLPFIAELKMGDRDDLRIGHRVAIIGGGNTAIDVAREAVRLGASEVTMIYRRDEAQMPAFRHEIEAAKAEGVKLMLLAAPLRFVGDLHVEGIECQRMELGEPDASGRPRPVPVPGSEFILEVDTVVKAIGQQPLSELFDALGVPTRKGMVTVDERYATQRAGVFAGGDCLNGGATVVEAVRDGRKAALGICEYLTGTAFPVAPEKVPTDRVEREGLIERHFQGDAHLDIADALCKGCGLCINSCPTDILYLDSKSKVRVTDIEKCVFCGLCEARCPDFAIWAVRAEEVRA